MASPRHRVRCTGHSSRTGKPCRAWAVRGARVCVVHGGRAPQVKAAAEVRRVEAEVVREAERMLALAGVDRDPIEHLLYELHRSTAVEAVWGSLVAKLDEAERGIDRAENPTTGEGLLARKFTGDAGYEAVIHPFVIAWNAERDRHAKLAKMAIDAGVADRQVRLAERQGEMVGELLRIALRAAGVTGDQERDAYGAVRNHLAIIRTA
jgi:hypothetical protein